MSAVVTPKVSAPLWPWRRAILSADGIRGAVGIAVLAFVWEIGSHSSQWIGFRMPWLGALPTPESVVWTWISLLGAAPYWTDLWLSFLRVLTGFVVAVLIGVPFGMALALNRVAFGVFFPVFEVVRPIPPIAWVPASILFWPTQNLSIGFVIFLGAFFTIVLNVLGGIRSIDERYFQAARSMGAPPMNVFRKIVIPGVLPSILVGAVVGMGISWEVVIAGELISGGGSAVGGSGGGIGFFIWNSYVTAGDGAESKIIVGMFSIGIMGYVSCEIIRSLGRVFTPWLRSR